MEISELRVFEAVARLLNMNRAAEELNTVQSNVTAKIRNLESELGVRLFERHSRGVVLTSAGAKLLPYATSAMRLIADAEKALSDEGGPMGRLVIGSLETTLAIHLSPLLVKFAAACPEVELTIRTGTTPELIDMVLDHRIEGAFVCGPVRHSDLTETVVFREELALFSSRALEALDDVLAAPKIKHLVLRAGCSYRQRLEDVFARRGVVASRALEFATLEAIFAGVAAGVGVTLMPRALAKSLEARHNLRIHRLPRQESEVTTLYVRRREAYVSKAQTAFLSLLKAGHLQRSAAE